MSRKVPSLPGPGLYELNYRGEGRTRVFIEARGLMDVGRAINALDERRDLPSEIPYRLPGPWDGDVIVDPAGQRWKADPRGFSSMDHPGCRMDYSFSPRQPEHVEAVAIATNRPKERER